MSNLLAVDPGLRNPAAALFKDSQLVKASRVKVPASYHKMELGQRVMGVVGLINHWWRQHVDHVDEVVAEWPRCYNRMKGDPADLFPLAGIGIGVAAMAGVTIFNTFAPTAPEWIGSLPKTTTGDPLASPRGDRIWSKLSPEERECVVLSHDSIDSVGLGLWRLGRLNAIKSFIGAS